MSRTNIRILKINSNFIEIRFVSEASAVRHGPTIDHVVLCLLSSINFTCHNKHQYKFYMTTTVDIYCLELGWQLEAYIYYMYIYIAGPADYYQPTQTL